MPTAVHRLTKLRIGNMELLVTLVRNFNEAGPMVVGYQNLLTLVSLKLVYKPPLLNLTGLKKFFQ